MPPQSPSLSSILSPYFSPREKSNSRLATETSVQHGNNRQEAELSCNIESVLEDPLRHDPLFCFYFRKFLGIYQLLYALKPVLIQEFVADDAWKLLVAVTLLNKTTAKAAIPVFWDIVARWPTPWAMSQACREELRDCLYHLGTHNIRSRRLIDMSKAYIVDPPSEHDARPSRTASPVKRLPKNKDPLRSKGFFSTPISHLPGTGPYALDSYRIFCLSYKKPFCEEWKSVRPTDKELVLYLRWKWAYEERKEWSPLTGHAIPADLEYLDSLVDELTGYHMKQKQE